MICIEFELGGEMLRRICLIVNYNLYESKRYFTEKFAEALERRGIETQIIDVKEQSLGPERIAALRKYAPDLTCSFNTLLPVSDDKFLWDFLETPHWSILLDPALYSLQFTRSPYTLLSCVDRTDVAYVKSSGFENAFFFPHAIEPELVSQGQERPYEVVFFGSCYDYESLRASWRQRNPEAVNKVLDDAIDLVFADHRTSLAEALVKAWNMSGLDPTGADFISLFYYLDNYTRGKDRVELIRSVKDARVHVFGELSTDNAVGILGWHPYLSGQSNVVLHPSVPFADYLTILQQSKICLNSMPFFKNGTHERVFTGLACGAVPITTDNIYFRDNFQPEKELCLYSMRDRRQVNSLINELLADESKRAAIALAGGQKVHQFHTWDQRVDALLEQLPAFIERITHSRHA